MFERFKGAVLSALKVPPEPHPPSGSPGSLRVFRAGRNYWRYKLALWSLKQAGAVFGLLVFLSMKPVMDDVSLPPKLSERLARRGLVTAVVDPETNSPRPLRVGDVSHWLVWLEVIGLVGLAVQMPFTLALTRLDYETRWYLATDRSLRIREGVWDVREMTMTFANVQNLAIRQGPIQRLLGIADLQVKTAGGGGTDPHDPASAKDNMHEGYFRGVDNADEIRDLILSLLRRYRGAGLGDPEEARHEIAHAAHPEVERGDAVAAARSLLAEARALRRAIDPA